MTVDSNKKLMNILKGALTRHDEFYNESVINYILQTIEPHYLTDVNLEVDYNNANIHSNFWGVVCYQLMKADNIELITRRHTNSNVDYLQKAIDDFDKYKTITQDKKNDWFNLLSQHNSDFVQAPIYKIEKQKRIGQLSYAGMFALKNPCEWAILYNENYEKWNITTEEQLFVLNSFFHRSNVHDVSGLNSEESNILLNMFIKHQEDVKQNYIQSSHINSEEQERAWMEYIVGAPMFCGLLNNASKEQLSCIFNDSSYKLLINKANLKINVENSPEMLSNILGIAEPEQWINAYSKNGNFNLLNFFENKFKRAYAQSLIKESFKSNYTYTKTKECFLEELEYLAPALRKAKIADKDRLKFWTVVIGTKNVELIIKVCKALELPLKDHIDNQKFYERCQNTVFKNENKEILSFDDLYRIAQCEVLDSLIPNKNSEVKKKKIKI